MDLGLLNFNMGFWTITLFELGLGLGFFLFGLLFYMGLVYFILGLALFSVRLSLGLEFKFWIGLSFGPSFHASIDESSLYKRGILNRLEV